MSQEQKKAFDPHALRWVQWAPQDLSTSLGGVETYARSLARELAALGVQADLSNEKKHPEEVLKNPQKKRTLVLHTHGSGPLPFGWHRKFRHAAQHGYEQTVFVHTLHGTSIGRMAACKEWLWAGGYAAYGKEWFGIVESDVVLAVHLNLHLFKAAHHLGKTVQVCGNGFDSDPATTVVTATESIPHAPHFAFVGRGDDQVKNTGFIEALLSELPPEVRLAAAPGSGFQPSDRIRATGTLSPPEVRALLLKSAGLLLPSHYEGLPLVVLEALALGVPVIAAPVGGLISLSDRHLVGLRLISTESPDLWKKAILANPQEFPIEKREVRARANQAKLDRWSDVAMRALTAVATHLSRSPSHHSTVGRPS